jgi:hypothetical protein
MSAHYPGLDALPAVPAPWRPSELKTPTPKRWGPAFREPWLSPRARFWIFAEACVAFCAWQWKLMLLWMVAPLFVGGCWCWCW